MNESTSNSQSRGQQRPPGFGGDGAGFGLWEAFDGLKDVLGQGMRMATPRMGRGDVKTAILALLAEEPMHGYQIIQEIESRSGGAWKPSPGSVYPTLQLLADEGLVHAEYSGERKTYSLTQSGREVADAASGSLPWESSTFRHAEQATVLPKAGAKLAQAVVQVSRGGTPEQIEKAVAVIDDARRKMYAILAED
ncbi:PadR family transcriptional regulator (plasmid) [Coraliomargarita sp. W4R53]